MICSKLDENEGAVGMVNAEKWRHAHIVCMYISQYASLFMYSLMYNVRYLTLGFFFFLILRRMGNNNA